MESNIGGIESKRIRFAWLRRLGAHAVLQGLLELNEEAPEVYTVKVNGQSYVVEVAEGGDVSNVTPAAPVAAAAPAPVVSTSGGEPVTAPLAGNIFKVHVSAGDAVAAGDVIVILEAMKMETEVRATRGGTVAAVKVKEGDTVAVGDVLVDLS